MTKKIDVLDTGNNNFQSMPHNQDAEQGILATVMYNNKIIEDVSDFLKPEDFYIEVHGMIYKAILHLSSIGQVADPVTLYNYFKDNEIT